MSSLYKKYVEKRKNVDVSRAGYIELIDWDYVDSNQRRILANLDIYEEEGDNYVKALDADKYDLYDCLSWLPPEYEDNEAAEYLLDMIEDAPHYLVMTHNCRWDGTSGYKIVDNIEETVRRDYEVTIYPRSVSNGGKCLICSEHSQDVQQGARTSIIALTEKEYALLNHCGISWDAVSAFARKCEAKAEGGSL